jgi:phospholipid transport system substrate-binding protein
MSHNHWSSNQLSATLRDAIFFLCFCVAPGHAAARTPSEIIQETVNSVLSTLQNSTLNDDSKRRQVKGIISDHFDYRAMSSRVLATNWKQTDQAQRRRFTSLFKELLTNTYWRKISGYDDETVEVVGEKIRNGKLATVNTLIRTGTVDIPVDYKLYRRDDGTWRAYDVVIEQVSLVRNYRGSFQTIVHDVGIEGLLTQLATKVAQSSEPAQ